MSKFAFLKTQEWKDLHQAMAQAERYTLTDARTALFHGRRAIELIVEWLYAADEAFSFSFSQVIGALEAPVTFEGGYL